MSKSPTSPTPKRRPRHTSRHAQRQRLERIADLYLRECYARRSAASSDEYAQQLGFTRQHLARVIADAFGVTPREFLRQRQLVYAEDLLRTTSYSTVEIAQMSAFGTDKRFYRAFRAAYGMTPGEYRNKVPK